MGMLSRFFALAFILACAQAEYFTACKKDKDCKDVTNASGDPYHSCAYYDFETFPGDEEYSGSACVPTDW
eukprot:CAMPEP_0170479986 /NCGR_PEP_ID=MMETSP0208-20121228/999_1 /TAXON_ID=197538 /ORGANISM="Strombidium inclinatum, Strain S3" /LENGTH=69 /DNA_ID=CAMNT_0010752457 /DNA_START=9 /DNA_END=215 /DNA_ORIENTATION=+